MTDNVSNTVITGRRINGPESPEPSIGTNFAVDSGKSPANDLDLRRSLPFVSRSPSCCSESFIITLRCLTSRPTGIGSYRGLEQRTVGELLWLQAQAQAGRLPRRSHRVSLRSRP